MDTFITLTVPALVALVGVLLVGGLRAAGVRWGWQAAYAGAYAGWCIGTAELARQGLLGAEGGWPLRLGIAGGLGALVLVATPAVRRAVDRLPLWTLVGVHGLRLPMGLVLLAVPGAIPVVALQEVVVGSSALLLAAAVKLKRLGRPAVAAWNLGGFGVLLLSASLLLPSATAGTPAWTSVWPGAWVPTVLGESFLAGHLILTRRVATESMLLGPWLSLASMVEAVLGTTWRRLWYGPQRPGWTWFYEATITWLRDRFTVLGSAPPRLVRRHVDVVGGLGSPRSQVDWARAWVHGRPGLWALPKHDDGDAMLFLHGGGYTFGSIRSHPGVIGALAERTRRRVLAIDYRLAPEHRCPAALEDAIAAWDHLVAEGWSPDRIVVFGDSAGGGLVAALLVALRERGTPQPEGAVLVSPWLDLALTGASVETWAGVDYLGTPAVLARYGRFYLGDLPATDPRASPLYADLHGLAPMLVLAGACEMLLDDAVRFAAKLESVGGEVTLDITPNEVHVFPMLATFSPQGAPAMDRIVAWIHGRADATS